MPTLKGTIIIFSEAIQVEGEGGTYRSKVIFVAVAPGLLALSTPTIFFTFSCFLVSWFLTSFFSIEYFFLISYKMHGKSSLTRYVDQWAIIHFFFSQKITFKKKISFFFTFKRCFEINLVILLTWIRIHITAHM